MAVNASKEEIEAGRGYETLFVTSLFAPWTHRLVDGAGVATGSSVLDIACGTGVLARHALSITGTGRRVVGLDPAPGMIAAATETEPGIEWTLGTAEELPFEDAAFDCVMSQFGMMFFADKQKAAGQMFRVLKPGGWLAVAVWDRIENNPAYADIIAVLDEQVSTEAGDALRLPYSLGNADDVTSFFKTAGFASVSCETATEQARFPSTRTMIEADLRGWLPLFDIHLDEAKIADVLRHSDEKLAKHATGSGEAVFQTSAHIITAQK